MNQSIRTIKRTSRIGLYGSLTAILLAALFYYASPYHFTQSDYTSRWMLIAGSVLAVLTVSMALLTVRRQVPQLRQTDDLDLKLSGYASYVRSLYLSLFGVVVVLCLMMTLGNLNVLLMLAIVVVLMQFLAFPNIYRIKADLGLTDAQMRTLFGSQYISSEDE